MYCLCSVVDLQPVRTELRHLQVQQPGAGFWLARSSCTITGATQQVRGRGEGGGGGREGERGGGGGGREEGRGGEGEGEEEGKGDCQGPISKYLHVCQFRMLMSMECECYGAMGGVKLVV